MTPTSSPNATPRGTERRVKRHNSDRRTRCANGRTKRLPSSCSRVGMLRRIRSARKVLDRVFVMVRRMPCSAERALARPVCDQLTETCDLGWNERSTPVAHQARLVSFPVALLDRLALVMGLFAAREGEFNF